MSSLTEDEGPEWEAEQQKREIRLNTGREGAHAAMPFQCETCWMRNLEGRDPVSGQDDKYISCLRRANLDAMVSKAPSTIKSHVRRIEDTINNCAAIHKTPYFAPRGPFPLEDQVGMGWAVDLLMKSLTGKGRIKKFIQWDAMRNLRATFTKTWSSSPQAIEEGATFSGNAARIRFTSCPSQSEWFGDFLAGAEDRMGYETRNQKFLPIPVVLKQLELIKRDAEEAEDEEEAKFLWKAGALICILTAGALRGHEGFYLDLHATRQHLETGRAGIVPKDVLKRQLFAEHECRNLPEICICLMGKFKARTGERCHSIILANETMSGLKVRWWVEKLIQICESEGRVTGYAFRAPNGGTPSSAEYNDLVRKYLKEIQDDFPSLFSPDEDLMRYGISRTYRKTAETRARRAGIHKDLCEAMCRWRTFEDAKGKRPREVMADHYADARELASLTWRHVYAL